MYQVKKNRMWLLVGWLSVSAAAGAGQTYKPLPTQPSVNRPPRKDMICTEVCVQKLLDQWGQRTICGLYKRVCK